MRGQSGHGYSSRIVKAAYIVMEAENQYPPRTAGASRVHPLTPAADPAPGSAAASTRPGSSTAAANALSAALWQERRVLNGVICALETMASASPSRTAPALDDMLLTLRAAGIARDIAVHDLSLPWDVRDDASLPELILGAPEAGPWPFILSSHLESMREQVRRIDDLEAILAAPAGKTHSSARQRDRQAPAGADRSRRQETLAAIPRQLRRFLQ